MSPLLTRALSAFVGLSLIFVLNYFFKETGLYILCSIIFMIMAHECGTLSFTSSKRFLLLLPLHSAYFISFYFYQNINLLFIFLLLEVIVWIWAHRKTSIQNDDFYLNHSKLYEFLFYSMVAPSFILAHLILTPHYESLFFLFFVVASFDTLSYFWGKSLGGRVFTSKLYPTSSPSKTIEGALFAALTCVPLTLVLDHKFLSYSFLNQFESLYLKIILILIVLLAALTGDLAESAIKRNAKIKDSGRLLPGHGGFFDRLDGLLFASIISYILIQF